MRVSVLVTLPPQETLRRSAANAFAAGPQGLEIGQRPDRSGLLLDDTFPALPLSANRTSGISIAAAAADTAPIFVTRGTIDIERIDEARAQNGVGIFADPEIGTFVPGCSGAPIGATADVEQLLDVAGLRGKGLDGSTVALAIMDTGIILAHLNAKGLKPKLRKRITWAPSGVPRKPGSYPVGHGTMCAYAALIAAPKATLLDFPILASTAKGGSVMSGFLSDALLAYSYLLSRMTGPGWRFRGLVINNSWGMYHPSWDFPVGHPGRYADNPNHPFNLIVGTVARAGADILFAAGNCGADCPDGRCQGNVRNTITGANAHPDVLTLAGCEIHDRRVGYSSQGPGITGMAAKKPDLTAYTHFLGSEAFGIGVPDSGTSTACPVAAGCVAAIRTKLSPATESPSGLAATFRAKVKPNYPRGWNRHYGSGIIRPMTAAAHYGL